jgi:hypothetical protein
MKKTPAIIMLAMLTLASAWAQQKPKLAEMILGKDGGWMSVSGVWRPDNLTKKNEPVEGSPNGTATVTVEKNSWKLRRSVCRQWLRLTMFQRLLFLRHPR